MRVEKISAAEAKKQMEQDKNIILLDVRSEKEHDEVRITNSILLPLGEIINNSEEVLQDKETKIFTYCHSGSRSSRAGMLLKMKGYNNVYNLGGIIDWPYEVEKGE